MSCYFFFRFALWFVFFIVSLYPTKLFCCFAYIAVCLAERGNEVKGILIKGRLRTLSSTSESRKFKSRRNATERPRWVYYTLQTSMVSADKCNISRRGLTRVAYPGQGDARARMWDRREVEHPRLSCLLLTTQFWRPPNLGSYRQNFIIAYGF